MELDEQYLHCTAYHEAAHIVVAAVLGIQLLKAGLSINEREGGFAAYKLAQPSGRVNLGADADMQRTILATHAGYIALVKCYPKAAHGDAFASSDFELIDTLLREMYSEPARRDSVNEELRQQSAELVVRHWDTIVEIAEALWAKEWVHTSRGREKRLQAGELVIILKERGILALIAD
jgi:hypothetical protein